MIYKEIKKLGLGLIYKFWFMKTSFTLNDTINIKCLVISVGINIIFVTNWAINMQVYYLLIQTEDDKIKGHNLHQEYLSSNHASHLFLFGFTGMWMRKTWVLHIWLASCVCESEVIRMHTDDEGAVLCHAMCWNYWCGPNEMLGKPMRLKLGLACLWEFSWETMPRAFVWTIYLWEEERSRGLSNHSGFTWSKTPKTFLHDFGLTCMRQRYSQ